MRNDSFENIAKVLKKGKSCLIFTHIVMDGDAIGSAAALCLAMRKEGIDAYVVTEDELAKNLSFLGKDLCIDVAEAEKMFSDGHDISVCVDCSEESRFPKRAALFNNGAVKVCIDHHKTADAICDYNYVDPVSPACAQILVKVLPYWDIEITKEIGTCLLTGIITDTGGFKYSGVTSETFEFAAWLLQKGVNVSNVYRNVLQTVTRSSFELNRIAMNRLEFYEDGKIAFTYITKEDEQNVNAETGDYEGIVDVGRDVEGVEVSIFLRELENGGYKVSLRSNDYVNVSDICLMFGGGGHIKAAGCTISNGTLESVRDKLIAQTKMYLK